jgi:hypothetical protein
LVHESGDSVAENLVGIKQKITSVFFLEVLVSVTSLFLEDKLSAGFFDLINAFLSMSLLAALGFMCGRAGITLGKVLFLGVALSIVSYVVGSLSFVEYIRPAPQVADWSSWRAFLGFSLANVIFLPVSLILVAIFYVAGRKKQL